MRATGALFIVLFIASSGTAIDRGAPENGYWWIESREMQKLGFIQGYVAGIIHAHALLTQELQIKRITINVTPSGENPLPAYLDFSEISYGQYIDGLDAFYKDYRNKRIRIDYALLFVRDQIRGLSREDSDRRLEAMRKGSVSLGYDDSN